MQSTIVNDRLKVSIDGPSEPQLISKLFLQVPVRELHNSMASPPEEGGIKEKRDAANNITIINYTLRSTLPTQIKKMSAQYKLICGFECCISVKIFIHHYYHGVIVIQITSNI